MPLLAGKLHKLTPSLLTKSKRNSWYKMLGKFVCKILKKYETTKFDSMWFVFVTALNSTLFGLAAKHNGGRRVLVMSRRTLLKLSMECHCPLLLFSLVFVG